MLNPDQIRLASASAFHRLPHGGHADLNLTSSGRVTVLVNTSGALADVLADLDTVRAQLARLQPTPIESAS